MTPQESTRETAFAMGALIAMPALACGCLLLTLDLASRWSPTWRVDDALALAAASFATVISAYLAAASAARLVRSVRVQARAPMSMSMGTLASDGYGDAALRITWVAAARQAGSTVPTISPSEVHSAPGSLA